MKKLSILTIVLMFLISACSSEPQTVTVQETVEVPVEVVQEVEVTRLVEVEVPVEVIQEVEVTRLVEVEVPVEVIVTATPEPEPTSPPAEEAIALNYIAEAESGDIHVQIARVVVANKDAIPQDFSRDSSFDDVDVVGEIIWIVTNNSEETLNVHPDQATVQINSELIDLFDYFLGSFGDDVGGEIPPGVQLIGGQWFGIKRNQVADVLEMTIRFNGPSNSDFRFVGEDFEIVVDLSNRTFEPLPEELGG